jgi:hypothetical protein
MERLNADGAESVAEWPIAGAEVTGSHTVHDAIWVESRIPRTIIWADPHTQTQI